MTWDVTHASGRRIEVRYSVVNGVPQLDDDKPFEHRAFYRNMLGRDHFHIFGYAALLLPEHYADDAPLKACITFAGLPPHWNFAGSFEATRDDGGASISLKASPQALRHAVYLGVRRIGTLGEEEARWYWFSEGFTEYLSHRLLLQSGTWTLEDYAAAINRVIERYASSPARNANNAQVLREFWTDPEVGRIPYQRGELLALHWSRRLASEGKSLDSTLRGLRLPKDRVPNELAKRPEDFAANRLRDAMRGHIGGEADADVERHIERGEPIAIDETFLGPCFSGALTERPRFEMGFDRASFTSRRLEGIVPGSKAETAGLRDGMELAGWSIHYGNTGKEVEIQVKKGQVVGTLRYLPVAAEPLRVILFNVTPGAREMAACRRWLGDA